MLRVELEHIMSEDVVTIKEGATIGQAAHLLMRFRINGILIVKKNNKDKVLGVVTTTDLLRLLDNALSLPGQRTSALKKIAKLPVLGVANRDIVTVQKNTKIERIIALMHKKNVHTIPVYDKQKLVGIVGRHDILNLAFSET